MSWQVWLLRILGVGALAGAAVVIGLAYDFQAKNQPGTMTGRRKRGDGEAEPIRIGPHWSRPLQGPLVDPSEQIPEPEPPPTRVVEQPKPSPPPIQLPPELVLEAILFGGKNQKSLAVLADGNTATACSKGESLLGAEIVRIERDRVVLSYKDTEFELTLDGDDRIP